MSDLIVRFLKEAVPPGGTREWKEWQSRYETLKHENREAAEPILLAALKEGDLAVQHAAVMGFRMLGYEAYGLGYDPELRYEIRSPDRQSHWIITPTIQTLEDQLRARQT
jgi:hypothetical protein